MSTTTSTPTPSPFVATYARSLGLDPAEVIGTGVAGRATLADVRAAHDRRLSAQAAFRPAALTPDDGWFPGLPRPTIEP